MEVHVDRDAFLRELQMVHNIVEPRQTIPILANVLVQADGETVRLTATDIEVGARVSVPGRSSARRDHALRQEAAGDRQGSPAAPLVIRVQENAWVALGAGVSYNRGPHARGLPGRRRWSPRRGSPGRESHRDMLTQTSFAISHDESGTPSMISSPSRGRICVWWRRAGIGCPRRGPLVDDPTGVRNRAEESGQEIAGIVGSGEEVRSPSLTTSSFSRCRISS